MARYLYHNGKVGQIEQTFEAGQEVTTLICQKEKVQDFKGLVKIGIVAAPGTMMEINGARIKISPSGCYELDNTVLIYSFKFPDGAEATIDYFF